MTILAGAEGDAVDVDLPDPVSATAGGTFVNTIVAASFSALPTNRVNANVTNPHPTLNMLCMVSVSAWMSASAPDVRASVDFSGATTIAAGVGGSGALGWGEVITCGTTASNQYSATYPVKLAPGTTTCEIFAYRTGAGSVAVNYATLRITPLRYTN